MSAPRVDAPTSTLVSAWLLFNGTSSEVRPQTLKPKPSSILDYDEKRATLGGASTATKLCEQKAMSVRGSAVRPSRWQSQGPQYWPTQASLPPLKNGSLRGSKSASPFYKLARAESYDEQQAMLMRRSGHRPFQTFRSIPRHSMTGASIREISTRNLATSGIRALLNSHERTMSYADQEAMLGTGCKQTPPSVRTGICDAQPNCVYSPCVAMQEASKMGYRFGVITRPPPPPCNHV